MNTTFVKDLRVIDSWVSQGERFRLVNLGAGPDALQTFRDDEWANESSHFVHGVLCSRILQLKNNPITISQAMDRIKSAMVEDEPSIQGSYAHSWHCNIAMMCRDAGATMKVANEGASGFMKLCFGVKTKQ